MTAVPPDPQGLDEPLTAHEPGDDTNRLRLTVAQAHGLRDPEPDGEPEPDPGSEPDPEDELGEGEPERLPAFMIPNLRPYADPKAVAALARRGARASRKPAASLGRRLLAALGSLGLTILAGTRILGRLFGGWLSGAYGKGGSVLARFGGVVVLLYLLARSFREWPTHTVIAIVWVWCLASICATRGAFDRLLKKPNAAKEKGAKKGERKPKKAEKKTQAKLTKDPAPAPAEGLDDAPGEAITEPPLMALIRELIGGDNGVHLAVLRPAMRKCLPGLAKATDQELRQVLITAGWDPSRTFRAGGVAGRAGIHRDQLPPHPFPGDGPAARSTHSPPESHSADLRK